MVRTTADGGFIVRAWLLTVLVLSVAASALTGCSASGASRPATTVTVTSSGSPAGSADEPLAAQPTSWDDIDWRTGRYPAVCAGSRTTALDVHNGEAAFSSDPDGGFPMRFVVDPPVFGTLGGIRAAAIKMHCEGANSSPDAVIVVVDSADGPRHLGYALDPQEKGAVTEMAFAEDMFYVGALTSSPGTPNCCPDIEFKYFYGLDSDGQLELLDSYRQPWTDPDSYSTATDAQDARDQACAQIPVLTDELRALQAQRQDLSGGSVEGIPTYSESSYYANLSQISAINMRIMAVQRALTSLRTAC